MDAILIGLFLPSMKDSIYNMTSGGVPDMTIDEIITMGPENAPRYMHLMDLNVISDAMVVSQNEETGEVMNTVFPVYRMDQMVESGSDASKAQAYVIIKEKDFEGSAVGGVFDYDAMYDSESLSEEVGILKANGFNINDNAIVITSGYPPSSSSSLIKALIGGILSLLVFLTFVPTKMLLGKDYVPETSEEENKAI